VATVVATTAPTAGIALLAPSRLLLLLLLASHAHLWRPNQVLAPACSMMLFLPTSCALLSSHADADAAAVTCKESGTDQTLIKLRQPPR